MTDCVCGMKPPERPNDDCERCQLICENKRLRQALEKYGRHIVNPESTYCAKFETYDNECTCGLDDALTHGGEGQ